MDVLYGLAKDFVFKDAVAFLKGKKALTSEESVTESALQRFWINRRISAGWKRSRPC